MALESLPSTGPEAATKQGWVLVIAREPHLRQLLLTVLNRVGYALLGCSTLDEAAEVLAKRTPPRLLLFDGGSASEETLREQIHQMGEALPPGASCRVMVFSLAHPQPRMPTLPGVDAVVARPFDLTQMLDRVEMLMQLP
jgi:DNA-binding NtrC family response regulator